MCRKQLHHLTHCLTSLAALAGGGNQAWPSQSINSLTRPHLCCSAGSVDSADLALMWWGDEQGLRRLLGTGPFCLGEWGSFLAWPMAWVCLTYSSLMVFCGLTHGFLSSLGEKWEVCYKIKNVMTYLWLVASSVAEVQAAAWLALGGGKVSAWCCSSTGGLVLLTGLYVMVPCRASPAWCLCRAQFLAAWGRSELGVLVVQGPMAQLAEAPVFHQQSHHHSGFLGHLWVAANLGLPALLEVLVPAWVLLVPGWLCPPTSQGRALPLLPA